MTLSRVLLASWLLFMGTTPIGGLIIGVLAEAVGVQLTVVILALGCGAGVLAAIVYKRWVRQQFEQVDVVAEDARAAEPPSLVLDEHQPNTPKQVIAATTKAPASARK